MRSPDDLPVAAASSAPLARSECIRSLTTLRLSGEEVVRVAAAATVDPRAVRRVIGGAPTRSTTRRRVLTALAQLGFVDAP